MNGNEKFLRRALLANGCFSLFSAAIILSFASPMAAIIGLPTPFWLWVLGPGLLVFGAVVLGLGMTADPVTAGKVRPIVWLDWGWVAGSVVAITVFGGQLTAIGVWLIADVALVVAVFAVLQRIGLRRTAAGQQTATG